MNQTALVQALDRVEADHVESGVCEFEGMNLRLTLGWHLLGLGTSRGPHPPSEWACEWIFGLALLQGTSRSTWDCRPRTLGKLDAFTNYGRGTRLAWVACSEVPSLRRSSSRLRGMMCQYGCGCRCSRCVVSWVMMDMGGGCGLVVCGQGTWNRQGRFQQWAMGPDKGSRGPGGSPRYLSTSMQA